MCDVLCFYIWLKLLLNWISSSVILYCVVCILFKVRQKVKHSRTFCASEPLSFLNLVWHIEFSFFFINAYFSDEYNVHFAELFFVVSVANRIRLWEILYRSLKVHRHPLANYFPCFVGLSSLWHTPHVHCLRFYILLFIEIQGWSRQ